ncbi:uncharacterized protein F5891DRAFT_1020246 [Suillus fuscotomentosus]|uniref:Uncharacterized protein n=1 Tax=Suillus fuscotomentosus TaxID=1912939 RepID=A0AAD4EBD6_9AGAM|nr:uncharacterized protein F5891DRAFT_1020246 [Suillus fuscotomentosus]KAG1903051.1 hypothetical protein F5891DRAFT_1020246 [Suillus fuscotomentosus]
MIFVVYSSFFISLNCWCLLLVHQSPFKRGLFHFRDFLTLGLVSTLYLKASSSANPGAARRMFPRSPVTPSISILGIWH